MAGYKTINAKRIIAQQTPPPFLPFHHLWYNCDNVPSSRNFRMAELSGSRIGAPC